MNALELLKQDIERLLPNASVKIDCPSNPDRTWWLDAENGDRTVTVKWSLQREFGIWIEPPSTYGYGEGPDEVYVDSINTLNRILEIIGKEKIPKSSLLVKTPHQHEGKSKIDVSPLLCLEFAKTNAEKSYGFLCELGLDPGVGWTFVGFGPVDQKFNWLIFMKWGEPISLPQIPGYEVTQVDQLGHTFAICKLADLNNRISPNMTAGRQGMVLWFSTYPHLPLSV